MRREATSKAATPAKPGPLPDAQDKELLREAGLSENDPVVARAVRLLSGQVRAVRKRGSKTWIHRKGTAGESK